MCKRICIISTVLLLLISIGCSQRPTPYFAPPRIVENVYDHIVSIAVYYYMPEAEWQRRQFDSSQEVQVNIDDAMDGEGKPVQCIAYIGSGTVLKDNHILTVRHLFDHEENTYSRKIWVFHQRVDHPMEADLIAIAENKTEDDRFNDYACLKLRENLGLPGLPIAPKDPKLGEKVMFGCSVGGTAYFMRFGVVSHFKWFFKKDDAGRLHLSKWREYHFTTVSPSGPGDSGSSVINTKGEIVGIIYIGVNIYEQMYCFSNPVDMLWKFLEEHHLKYLALSQYFSQ